jgi:hypothetical protein
VKDILERQPRAGIAISSYAKIPQHLLGVYTYLTVKEYFPQANLDVIVSDIARVMMFSLQAPRYTGWIHAKRRNRLHHTLVEKLVRSHTNLVVLRESLDDALHHLLPWDIEFIIDEPVDQTEEEPEV